MKEITDSIQWNNQHYCTLDFMKSELESYGKTVSIKTLQRFSTVTSEISCIQVGRDLLINYREVLIHYNLR